MSETGGLQNYVVDENGCWVWQGCVSARGYAQMRIRGRTYSAHRIAYERAKGTIPQGLVIDHLCRVRACVNPDHLEAVTDTENKRRGKNIKLSPAAVVIIRSTPRVFGYRQKLAAQFGISPYTVDGVVHGHRWKEIQPA